MAAAMEKFPRSLVDTVRCAIEVQNAMVERMVFARETSDV
jgi:hypothetical protein